MPRGPKRIAAAWEGEAAPTLAGSTPWFARAVVTLLLIVARHHESESMVKVTFNTGVPA
jgi:hypothetical protein